MLYKIEVILCFNFPVALDDALPGPKPPELLYIPCAYSPRTHNVAMPILVESYGVKAQELDFSGPIDPHFTYEVSRLVHKQ